MRRGTREGLRREAKGPLPDGMSYRSRTDVLRILGFRCYQEYLASDMWAEVKKAVLRAKGPECELCGKAWVDLHHLRYSMEAMLGREPRHIIPLCRDCHHKVEFTDGKKLDATQSRHKFYALMRASGRKRAWADDLATCERKERRPEPPMFRPKAEKHQRDNRVQEVNCPDGFRANRFTMSRATDKNLMFVIMHRLADRRLRSLAKGVLKGRAQAAAASRPPKEPVPMEPKPQKEKSSHATAKPVRPAPGTGRVPRLLVPFRAGGAT